MSQKRMPLADYDLTQLNEVPRGTIHEFFEGDTPLEPLRVVHKTRGEGLLLATNPEDGLAYVKWEKAIKGMDVAGTWERSWVAINCLEILVPRRTFFDELDATGMPPGWIAATVPALVNQLDRVKAHIAALLVKEGNLGRGEAESVIETIISYVMNGSPQ